MKLMFLILLTLLFSCSLRRPGKLVSGESGKEHFCVVGDVGSGSYSQMKVAEAMRESGCDKLILLGDVIYPHGISDPEDHDLKERFYKPYKNFKKIYIVLGNHDYEGNAAAWKEISLLKDFVIHPSNYFHEKVGNTCLFFLDTNFRTDNELLTKESLWLRNSISDCKYKAAFTHHPYFNSGDRHGHATHDVKLFYENEIIGKFNIIFSGHEHVMMDEGVTNGTRQIITGAGGKHDLGVHPGFTIFTIDKKHPEKSTYQLIQL